MEVEQLKERVAVLEVHLGIQKMAAVSNNL